MCTKSLGVPKQQAASPSCGTQGLPTLPPGPEKRGVLTEVDETPRGEGGSLGILGQEVRSGLIEVQLDIGS